MTLKVRRHVTIPPEALKLFTEYAEHHQRSLSSFLTEAGLRTIYSQGGRWMKKADAVENPDDVVTAEQIRSMTREEREQWVEQWR